MLEKLPGTRGEIYDRYMVPGIFGLWAPDLVDSARVRPGERVLDVACGTGVVTRVLAERVGPTGRVVGLDSNSDMLAAARAASSQSNIEWLLENAMSMSLPDQVFDATVCQQGFQFIPDKPAVLREMRRVLVPGGRLALSVWRSVDQSPAFRILRDYLARRLGHEKAALRPFGLPDGQAIGAMIASAGFRDVKVRAEIKISRFQSPEHMVRASPAAHPLCSALSSSRGRTRSKPWRWRSLRPRGPTLTMRAGQHQWLATSLQRWFDAALPHTPLAPNCGLVGKLAKPLG